MASIKPRSSSRNKGGVDGSRSQRAGGVKDISREEVPSITRITRREADNMVRVPSNSQTRIQSRIPQSPSVRRPSGSGGVRPPLTHETQSWSSTSSGSSRSVTNALNPAAPAIRDTGLKQPRNVLRRKQSTVAREPATLRNMSRANSGGTSSSSSIPKSQTAADVYSPYLDRSLTESPVEFQVAPKFDEPKALTQTMVYPELDRYRDILIPRDEPSSEILFRLATHDLPPPTPLFSSGSTHSQMSTFSGSPSTRFSESPGPGPYSRDTTPTSMSSTSPGLIAPLRNPASRVKQASPAQTRPPVTRRRAGSISNDKDDFSADAQGLAAVRETLTSSSSNSTVRDADKDEKKRRRVIPPEPPNPPPRKSSQKFKNDGDGVDESPSKPARVPTQPVMGSPPPTSTQMFASPREKSQRVITSPQPRPTPPSRPSRENTPDLYSQYGDPIPIVHSNLSSSSLTDRRQSGQLAPSSMPRYAGLSSSDRPGRSNAPTIGREPTPAPRSASALNTERPKPETGRAVRTPSPGVSNFRSRFGLFGRRTKTETDVPRPDKKERPPRKGPAAGTGHEGYGRMGAVRRRSSNVENLSRGLSGPVSSSESLASAQSADPFLLERLNPVIIAGGEVVENQNVSASLSRAESNQSLPFQNRSIKSRNGSEVSMSSREEVRNTLWPSLQSRSRRPSDSSDSEAVTMKSTLAFRRSAQRLRSSPDQEPMKLPKSIKVRGIASPPVGSMDTAIMKDDSLAEAELNTGPKKLTKRAKTPHRWNLFSKSHSQAEKAPAKKEETRPMAAASKPAQRKPVAFYTMMDSSEQEDGGDADVDAILRDAEFVLPGILPPPSVTRRRERSLSTSSRNKEPTTTRHRRTPSQTRDSPMPASSQPPRAQKSVMSSASRPSRLPQVGRIPKVVNTRPEQTSPKSFSRPFNRVSVQLPPPRSTHVDRSSVAKGPSPERPSTPEVARDNFTGQDASDCVPMDQQSGEARKNSGYTSNSGSSSSGLPSFANHTAVVPEPTAPLAEDEIWDEYNDLFGDVPPSATLPKATPSHLDVPESKSVKKIGKTVKPLESPTVNEQHIKETRDSIETGKAATSSSHFSADMTARINAAFRFGPDPPSTPFSVSDFAESSKVRVSNSSTASEETPLSQVNLRVGSMTVSKWLTFSNVLFSPVRDHLIQVVGSLKRHSILVIDGLGNDDWSFYAAETYPAATFFNLSPRAPLSEEHRTTSFPLSPPNHHQIQYTSPKDKFPFGPDSFTTVVFRFPSAAPESHYRNIISEAHRVLKPGGYVELSILDVDLNNMGNRSRRAVRRLKERINIQNPDICLSSTSDLLIRLLGRKGFMDIKTCRVGIPVASAITKSSQGGEGVKKKKDERSLAEMMNDETEMGDENITNMVARVGRWWYHRLYQSSMGINGSIWNDRALLAECEELGTSLKLMVCHARIPETRTRVSSI